MQMRTLRTPIVPALFPYGAFGAGVSRCTGWVVAYISSVLLAQVFPLPVFRNCCRAGMLSMYLPGLLCTHTDTHTHTHH